MNVIRRQHSRPETASSRRGSILYVVLVIVALLTLAAYQFSEIMVTERTATDLYGRRVQARAFSDSGVEAAAAMLGEQQLITSDNVADVNLYHNPGVFGAVLMQGTDTDKPRARGRYAVLAPVESDADAKTVRFGLADESGKLNLNTLLTVIGDDGDDEEADPRARNVLLALPGMTSEMADAILDWLDEDDEVREFGAELEYYGRYDYEPANGPLESIDELLLIRPDLITPQLVFGFDTNRNGILDGAEIAAAEENSDGHPLGWNAFLTIHSRESNLKLSGDPKTDLNNGDLAGLYDEIVENTEIGNAEDVAKFIVAYRMYGPKDTENNQPAGQ
ncbi:MAG: general secretion pathway protein GspK, partial [Planctomycetaceae bacterium]